MPFRFAWTTKCRSSFLISFARTISNAWFSGRRSGPWLRRERVAPHGHGSISSLSFPRLATVRREIVAGLIFRLDGPTIRRVFASREDAGRRLGRWLQDRGIETDLVLGLP